MFIPNLWQIKQLKVSSRYKDLYIEFEYAFFLQCEILLLQMQLLYS